MRATIAKPANHTNNTGIASKCMLVSITIKAPTASRVDKDATHEVITNKHAAHDAGRFTKKLFDKAAFAEVQTAMSALRNEHYRLTLPWANDGARILPASGYDNYMVTMRGLREAFDKAVNNFLNDYNDSVERAKERLGDMFNANDYASDVDIAKKFDVSLRVFPMPTANDFRVDMDQDTINDIRHDIERQTQETIANSQQHIFNEVATLLGRMVERLDAYAPGKRSRDNNTKTQGIFRDSLVTNIRDIVQILPGLNIANSEAINDIIKQLDDIAQENPKELRNDPHVRNDTKRKAKQLLDTVNSYIV